MDYDEILSGNNGTTNYTEYHYQLTPTEITLDCIRFLVCLFGTAIDVFMIYIIMRFKNMKKPVNIYLMNWLICDALFILVDPTEYQIYSLMKGFGVSWDLICVMFTCVIIIRTLDVLFMLVFMFYWFFDKTKVTLFERHCKRVVTAVWVFGLFEFLVLATQCLLQDSYSFIGEIFFAGSTATFLICFMIIHCKRRCSNPFASAGSLPVALLTSFVLCWAIVFIILLTFNLLNIHMHMVVIFLGQLLIYLYPVAIFYLFYKMDQQFSTCVRVLLRWNTAEDIDTCCIEEMGDEKDDDEIHSP